MRATVIRWFEMCGQSVPPIDELLAAGYPIAALAVAGVAVRSDLHTEFDAARMRRAIAACLGVWHDRALADIPAGMVVSMFADPDVIDIGTDPSDGIRAGYACPSWVDVGESTAVARLRAGADPAARAAAVRWPSDERPAPGDVPGGVVYCAGGSDCVARSAAAAAVGEIDPEAALAICLARLLAGRTARLGESARRAPAHLIADALEQKKVAGRIVLPPIIV